MSEDRFITVYGVQWGKAAILKRRAEPVNDVYLRVELVKGRRLSRQVWSNTFHCWCRTWEEAKAEGLRRLQDIIRGKENQLKQVTNPKTIIAIGMDIGKFQDTYLTLEGMTKPSET